MFVFEFVFSPTSVPNTTAPMSISNTSTKQKKTKCPHGSCHMKQLIFQKPDHMCCTQVGGGILVRSHVAYEQQEPEVPEQLPLRQFPRLPIILATQPNSCHPNSPQPLLTPKYKPPLENKEQISCFGNLQIAILMVRNSCHRPGSAPPKYLPSPPPPLFVNVNVKDSRGHVVPE